MLIRIQATIDPDPKYWLKQNNKKKAGLWNRPRIHWGWWTRIRNPYPGAKLVREKHCF
jgi:hypothetical protein